MPLINWVKTHKLITALVLIIAFLLFRNSLSSFSGVSVTTRETLPSESADVSSLGQAETPSFSLKSSSGSTAETTTGSNDRIVIKNSNLSLLVKDVRKTGEQILSYTKNAGGYMVSTSYNRPSESPFATITVRVPTEKLDEALNYFRSLAIKVTSENLVGTDVTEDYTDIQARIASLEKTKAIFEGILSKTAVVSEIVNIQKEIINTQEQIDYLKGQQKALDENARQTKITLYLSTDELALPYAPDKTFRPTVIFKQAVRSLLNTLRIGGEALIWVGVYAVIWVPALIIFFLYRRWRQKRQASAPQIK